MLGVKDRAENTPEGEATRFATEPHRPRGPEPTRTTPTASQPESPGTKALTSESVDTAATARTSGSTVERRGAYTWQKPAEEPQAKR